MPFLANIRLQHLLFFFLPLLLYANTLGHGFLLDDTVTITENRFVQAGLSGIPEIFSKNSYAGFLPEGKEDNPVAGGRYRPLSLLFFAVLVQLFGTNSVVFHLLAVLLYAATCLLLYRVMLLALKPVRGEEFATLVAWGTTLLFAAHPVHTEVVANVKSCDEQLALLAGLGVLYSILKGFDTPHWKWAGAAGVLFFLACLAKENAGILLLLAPLALWFFRRGLPAPSAKQQILLVFLPLLLAFTAAIVLRGMALNWHFQAESVDDPLNNSFLKSDGKQWVPFTPGEKAATILYTLFQYARLLVWPYPLTHDYFPFQIEPQSFSKPAVLAGLVLYTLLLIAAIWGLIKRKPFAFGIWWIILPLLIVANIFFPVGTFMAERFLFLPSVGYCFALTLVLVWATGRMKEWRLPATVPMAGLALIFSMMTVLRNPAWSDIKNLSQTDLSTSPESAKLRNTLGTILLTEALLTIDTTQRRLILQEAETHLKHAVDLHPSYYDALLAYGATTFYLQQYDRSITAYRGAGRMNPEDKKPKDGLALALRYGGEYYARKNPDLRRAIGYLTESWQMNPDTATATMLAGQYEMLGQPAEAAQWLEKAVTLAPDDPQLLQALVKAYKVAGENAKAAEVEKRAKLFTTFAPSFR